MGLFGRTYAIGILFDIDALGTLYGEAAYRIVFSCLDPRRVTQSVIHDGDTYATLAGSDRIYCIAFQVSRKRQIDYIRDAFADRTDRGLRPAHCRFIEGRITKHEPLVPAGAVNPAGVFAVWEDDMVQPSWAEGTAWRIGFIPRP